MPWDYIRGEKLKKHHEIAYARVGHLIKSFYEDSDWLDTHNIMHSYVYNILFANAKSAKEIVSFQDYYRRVLPNTGIKTPVPFIVPHVMGIANKAINNFCNEIWSRQKQDRTFIISNNLEKLALDFFMNERYGLENMKREKPQMTDLFKPQAMFTAYHHSKCRESVKEIECGKGRKKSDWFWNIEYRETEGISYYGRNNSLFDDEDKSLYQERLRQEQALANLNSKWAREPNPETGNKIKSVRNEIEKINKSIYGIHIPEFMNPAARADFVIQMTLGMNFPVGTGMRYSAEENKFISCTKYECDVSRSELQMLNLPLSLRPTSGHKTIRSNDNVQLNRFLYESDNLEIPEQKAIMESLKPQMFRAVFSGNKSIHMIFRLPPAFKNLLQSPEEYQVFWCMLAKELGFAEGNMDKATKSPSNLTRAPNSPHGPQRFQRGRGFRADGSSHPGAGYSRTLAL